MERRKGINEGNVEEKDFDSNSDGWDEDEIIREGMLQISKKKR
jgi:hypothetical protein